MAFSRRFRTRRRSFRRKGRRRFRRRRMNPTRRLALRALRLVKGEKEHKDIELTATSYTQTGTLIPLIYMQRGNAVGSRTGDQINLIGISFKINSTYNAALGTPADLRFALILDKSQTGTLPTTTELLDVTLLTEIGEAHRVVNQQTRFSWIFDKHFSLTSTSQRRLFTRYQKFRKGLKIYYKSDQNVGDITDLTTRNLFIVFWTGAASSAPTFKGTIRVWFMK